MVSKDHFVLGVAVFECCFEPIVLGFPECPCPTSRLGGGIALIPIYIEHYEKCIAPCPGVIVFGMIKSIWFFCGVAGIEAIWVGVGVIEFAVISAVVGEVVSWIFEQVIIHFTFVITQANVEWDGMGDCPEKWSVIFMKRINFCGCDGERIVVIAKYVAQ